MAGAGAAATGSDAPIPHKSHHRRKSAKALLAAASMGATHKAPSADPNGAPVLDPASADPLEV